VQLIIFVKHLSIMTLAKKSPVWLLSILLFCSLFSKAQEATELDLEKWYETAIQLTNKNIDSSFLLASKIHDASIKMNSEDGVIKAKILSGYYYWEKFKLDTAKHLLNESINYFAQHAENKNKLDHGRAWFYLGLVSIRTQDVQNAKKCGNTALSLFTEIGNTKYMANALNFLGGVQMSLTNYPSSLDYYTKAYKVRIESGEPVESCLSEISNISTVYSYMGLHDDAIKYAKQSFEIAKKNNDNDRTINSLNKIGTFYSSKGNIDSAILYLNEAKREAVTSANSSMEYVVDFNIANTYSNNGRYNEAGKIIRKLLANTNQQRGGMYDGARALQSKNFLKSGKYDSAVLTARSLYQEVIKKTNKQMTINVTEILWKAFQQKDKYDSAFKYLDMHFTLKDSVYNITNQRKLSSLYAEMESIEKENEIKILETEKEIQAIENRNLIIIIISGSAITILFTISIVLAFKNREKKQRLKNIALQDEIDKKKNDLHQQALRIIYINNSLTTKTEYSR
jgi:tetratricopeptide (TPR) repeat protein